MRGMRILFAVTSSAVTLGALAAGCYYYEDECYNIGTCAPGTGASSSSSGTMTATGGADSGPDCSGDPNSTNIIDGCGIFAKADAPTGGTGSMAMPYAKLADAIAAAQTAGKRVYACTSAPFTEAVTLSAGIEVYGGLDCSKGWSWTQGGRATLTGPVDAIALTITSAASGAKVEGFVITGASPSIMTKGASSIAVAVDDVAATLDHCDVTASDAADGVDGQTPTTPVTTGTDAPAPTAMVENACTNPPSLAGGPRGVTMCGSIDTSGGIGGKGGVTGTMSGNGQSGSNGANPAASPIVGMDGLGGVGQTDPAGICTPGDPGAPGSNGSPGVGGSAMGDVLALAGITNNDDTDGSPGTPAQGGGGGGGAKSGVFCAGSTDGNGASGGGAGAGGCGGLGGGGGRAGGSSIAIVSLGKTFTIGADVTLAAGKGGKGGSGAINQTGGSGGSGAKGGSNSGAGMSIDGCKGGDGGKGGNGGPGGGGRGGHALGIAYAVTPAPMPAIQMFTPGTSGGGGTAGSGAPTTSNGASGNAAQCWDFSTGMACK
jgi:hypothetical protein